MERFRQLSQKAIATKCGFCNYKEVIVNPGQTYIDVYVDKKYRKCGGGAMIATQLISALLFSPTDFPVHYSQQ